MCKRSTKNILLAFILKDLNKVSPEILNITKKTLPFINNSAITFTLKASAKSINSVCARQFYPSSF